MKTNQPKYQLAANIGDIDPLENLRLVYVDTTGVYPPVLVYGEEIGGGSYLVARVECRRCTMRGNRPETLSDNRFHADVPAWFADRIGEVAGFVDNRDLAAALCGMCPVERARAYESLVSFFGMEEFDSYPKTMTWAGVKRSYRAAFRK